VHRHTNSACDSKNTDEQVQDHRHDNPSEETSETCATKSRDRMDPDHCKPKDKKYETETQYYDTIGRVVGSGWVTGVEVCDHWNWKEHKMD
jgi:hypothetical protein